MKSKIPAGSFILRRKYYGEHSGVSPVFTSTFVESSVVWTVTPHPLLTSSTNKKSYVQTTDECGCSRQGAG